MICEERKIFNIFYKFNFIGVKKLNLVLKHSKLMVSFRKWIVTRFPHTY